MKKSTLTTLDLNITEDRSKKRLYITKTRWGVYEVLNEQQYERKLICG